MHNMKKENKSILISCIEEISKKNDKINININRDFVTITFAANGIIGQHQLSYEDFKELLNSDLNTETVLSDWIGMAFNRILEKKESDVRLMI